MSRRGRKATGPIEIMARVHWLEDQLAMLSPAEADPISDPAGWRAEKRAFLDGVEMIRLSLETREPAGRFGEIGGAETLTMMGIRAQSRIGGADVMRRWIVKARQEATRPARKAA